MESAPDGEEEAGSQQCRDATNRGWQVIVMVNPAREAVKGQAI